MTQKLPDSKPNNSAGDGFELHVKVPEGGEFNLKLQPKTWRKFTALIKHPLLWALALLLGGGSVMPVEFMNHLLPNPPKNVPR
jgi:hypothetical protein